MKLPQRAERFAGRMSLVETTADAVAHKRAVCKLIKGYMAAAQSDPGDPGLAQVHGMRGETSGTVEQMEARLKI